MQHVRRILVFPLLLGVILSFTGLARAVVPASADAIGNVTCTGNADSTSTCTITLSYQIGVGGTWTAAVPNGNVIENCNSTPTGSVPCNVNSGVAMFTCSGGCSAGSQFVVVVQAPPAVAQGVTLAVISPAAGTPPTFSAQPGITVSPAQNTVNVPQNSFAYPQTQYPQNVIQTGPTGGQCVGYSYATSYGCTAGYVPILAPYYPSSYSSGYGTCGGYFSFCGGCGTILLSCNIGVNNGCYGIWNACGNNCFGIWNACRNNCVGIWGACGGNNNNNNHQHCFPFVWNGGGNGGGNGGWNGHNGHNSGGGPAWNMNWNGGGNGGGNNWHC